MPAARGCAGGAAEAAGEGGRVAGDLLQDQLGLERAGEVVERLGLAGDLVPVPLAGDVRRVPERGVAAGLDDARCVAAVGAAGRDRVDEVGLQLAVESGGFP